MYGSLIPLSTYEKDSYCITADYSVINSESASVVNSARRDSPQGNLRNISFLRVGEVNSPQALE
jgi:lipocalin